LINGGVLVDFIINKYKNRKFMVKINKFFGKFGKIHKYRRIE